MSTLLAVMLLLSESVIGAPSTAELRTVTPIALLEKSFDHSVVGDGSVKSFGQFEQLYPLGWGAKGLFAYCLNEGSLLQPLLSRDTFGCSSHFGILDLRTDKHLEEEGFNSGYADVMDAADLQPTPPVLGVGKKAARARKVLLNKHHIEESSEFELLSLPIKLDDDVLDIVIQERDATKPDDSYNPEAKLKVKAVSKLQGSKIVYEGRFLRGSGFKSLGLLKHPKEDVAALILGYYQSPTCGGFSRLQMHLVGVNLKTGFKK